MIKPFVLCIGIVGVLISVGCGHELEDKPKLLPDETLGQQIVAKADGLYVENGKSQTLITEDYTLFLPFEDNVYYVTGQQIYRYTLKTSETVIVAKDVSHVMKIKGALAYQVGASLYVIKDEGIVQMSDNVVQVQPTANSVVYLTEEKTLYKDDRLLAKDVISFNVVDDEVVYEVQTFGALQDTYGLWENPTGGYILISELNMIMYDEFGLFQNEIIYDDAFEQGAMCFSFVSEATDDPSLVISVTIVDDETLIWEEWGNEIVLLRVSEARHGWLSLLSEIESQVEVIWAEELLSTDEMEEASYESFVLYDALLNDLYQALQETLDEASFMTLQEQQRQWIINRDESAEVAYHSMTPAMANLNYQEAMKELTRERCVALIELF